MRLACAFPFFFAILAHVAPAHAAEANPLGKVIELRGSLTAKIIKEGEAEAKAYKDPPKAIFYINLDRSTDRKLHMERGLSGFVGRVVRVPAVADTTPYSQYVQQQGLDERLDGNSSTGRATISCWLSHVTLWKRLQTELGPHETALILEDDVQFPPDWTKGLSETLQSGPRGWHVLKVCGWGHERTADVVDGTWAAPHWPIWEDGKWFYTGSCGYLVAGSAIPHLLGHVLSQPIKDIDVAMMNPQHAPVASANLKIYEQRPGRRLLGTGGFPSTMRASGQGYYGYYDLLFDSVPGCYNNRQPVGCEGPYTEPGSCNDPTEKNLVKQLCCKHPNVRALPGTLCTAPSEPMPVLTSVPGCFNAWASARRCKGEYAAVGSCTSMQYAPKYDSWRNTLCCKAGVMPVEEIDGSGVSQSGPKRRQCTVESPDIDYHQLFTTAHKLGDDGVSGAIEVSWAAAVAFVAIAAAATFFTTRRIRRGEFQTMGSQEAMLELVE